MKKKVKFKFSQRKADLLKKLYFTEVVYKKYASKVEVTWLKSLWLEKLRELK